MICMVRQLRSILPDKIDNAYDWTKVDKLRQIKMRVGGNVLFETDYGIVKTGVVCKKDDLSYVINVASKYSPWKANTVRQGYLTAAGGHRIGVCGQVTRDNSGIQGIHDPSSLCIRVAKDFHGISSKIPIDQSILILGPPGSGKTTLLRDLIRRISNNSSAISVIDERGELFPWTGADPGFDPGMNTDVYSGCTKSEGIYMALRAMCPGWIALDEITDPTDCTGIRNAVGCGVKIIATAHAENATDLMIRPIYATLYSMELFPRAVVLRPDGGFQIERLVKQ